MKNERHEMYEIPERKASKFLRRINIFTVHDEYVHPLTLHKKEKIEPESRVVCLSTSCFASLERRREWLHPLEIHINVYLHSFNNKFFSFF